MSAAPLLVTDRLELWLPQAADLRAMHAIVCEEQTGRFLGRDNSFTDHFMRFARNAGSWQLYGYGDFMLRERASGGVLLGNCGVFHTVRGLGEDFDDRPEAGWILRASHTGKGLAGEAMRAVLDWFDREHGPREVMCMISPENAPSLRLADKLGFKAFRDAELASDEAVRLLRRAPPPAG